MNNMPGLSTRLPLWPQKNRSLVVLFFAYLAYKVVKFLRRMRQRAALLRALPGPKCGEHEHWLLGHVGGDLIIRGDESFDIQNLMNVSVPRFMELAQSEQYRDEGMLRLTVANSNIPVLNSLGTVLIWDMKLTRNLLSSKSMPHHRKGMAYVVSKPLIGNGVLSSTGHKWLKQRKPVEKGMRHEVLEPGLPQVAKTANELADKLNPGQTFAVHEEMYKLTMDVIGRVAFDWDFGSVTAETTSNAPLYDAFNVILVGLAERLLNPLLYAFSFLPIEKNRKLNASLARLDDQVEQIIASGYKKLDVDEELQKAYEQDPSSERPVKFLLKELLIAERAGELTPTEVRDNIKTLLFAGHDTTGAALSWAFYLLTKHPEAQARLYKEICEHCGPDGDPSYDGLEDMEFLNAVVLEVLRLYPSAGFTREPREDVDLGDGRIIPANTEVFIFPYISHRDPRNYDRPDEFVPERWMVSEGGSEAKYCGDVETTKHSESGSRAKSIQSRLGRHSMNRPMLPFSLGQRGCVGRPLALMEIRVVLIKLLQRFKLQFPEKPDPEFQETPLLSLTLNPKSIQLTPVPRRDDECF